jgi:hypothetical protein
MLELSMNKICSEFVENTCVEDTDANAIGSQIVSKENIEAVVHNPVANFGHRIAAVFEVALKEMDFSEMNDWVLWTKLVKWNNSFSNLLNSQVVLLFFAGYACKVKIRCLTYTLGSSRQVSGRSFVRCTVSPVTGLSHLFEVLDFRGVLTFPMFGLLDLNGSWDAIDGVQSFFVFLQTTLGD